jgi:hypothetical protein
MRRARVKLHVEAMNGLAWRHRDDGRYDLAKECEEAIADFLREQHELEDLRTWYADATATGH